MGRLFNPITTHRTTNDLIEASKGIHKALKSSLPPMVQEAVGAILHKEMENRFNELAKSYEMRLADMRESYEKRLYDLQEVNDKNLEDLHDLVKSVSVPGVTEDVGMELVVRTTKMLETKVEKRLSEICSVFDKNYGVLRDDIFAAIEGVQKSFEDRQGTLIEFIKNFTVQNSFVLPENGIQTHVEVKQLPSHVDVHVPKDSIHVQANAVLKETKAPQVNITLPKDSIKVEHRTLLDEADKISEKSISYSESTGRPEKITEKITRIKK